VKLSEVERRVQRERKRRHSTARARLLAAGALIAVAGVLAAIIVSTTGGGTSSNAKQSAQQKPTTTKPASAKPGTAAVPILTYHVINSAPAGSGASPDLYVPGSEFTAQMQALKSAGWHAVTLNQLQAYWTKGTPLPAGKPIVVTFDGGFASQYTNALPVLKGLGWVGVVNLPSNGRSPTDGGLADDQTRGLIAAGWELDAGGNDSPDLTGLSTTAIVQEVKTERQDLQSRFGAAVNWYSYASGRYNGTVVGALSEAGFTGATTLVSGWADPKEDRFRLPRIQVAGGTSPTELVSKITAARSDPAPPDASSGV
jgi:peptidoglycan/xylan/chitin deacetylase (PgdA/CDA1 family)